MLLSTRQIADKLKVSQRYVRAIKDRIGSWKVISGMLWFDPRAVEAFHQKRERARAKRKHQRAEREHQRHAAKLR